MDRGNLHSDERYSLDSYMFMQGFHAGTNVALDLDERQMPRGPLFPRFVPHLIRVNIDLHMFGDKDDAGAATVRAVQVRSQPHRMLQVHPPDSLG